MAKEKTETTKTTLYERSDISGHYKGNKIYYKIPHFVGKEEVVDMDAFQPISEAIKKLAGKRELTGDEVQTYYDFASGADNHAEIPFNRSAENLDLAMLSEHVRNEQNRIAGEITDAQEELAIRQGVNDSMAKQ